MPPKKKAAPRGSRQSPILSMLVDSPDRGHSSSTSGSNARLKPLSSFGFQNHAFGNAAVKTSKGIRAAPQKSSPLVAQGKAKEEPIRADLLWCDAYAPCQKSELGIHKKKIEQVEGWLKEALNGKNAIKRYRRILVLSGPAGSGKSTLIRTLSRSDELNFQITEWNSDDAHAGLDADYYWDRGRQSEQGYTFDGDTERAPVSGKLNSFLSNASLYSTLTMQSEDDPTLADTTLIEAPPATSSRRIILLEDLPNLSHLVTRNPFHATHDTFLQRMGGNNITPLVIIVSESVPRLDEWGAEGLSRNYKDRNESTLTVRNLIPAFVRSSVGFLNIEFNAVAPTILTKALKRILELARLSHPNTIPAPLSMTAREIMAVVIESAEGDLRNAVNTLQMICTHSGSALLEKRGIKRKANGKSESKVSKRAIAAVSGKETSLVIFHALGKILYNKRVGDPNDDNDDDDEDDDEDDLTQETAIDDVDILPEHWQSLLRRPSKVDCEMLWRSMPVDASTLQAWLHQNYTPFCDDIDQCAALSDNVSFASSVRPAHEEWSHTTLTDYYNFLITVHGSLISLPSPVSRNGVRKIRGVALFKVMKELRENTERLDDIRVAFREDAQEEEEVISSTLSASSSTNLICEVLPMLSKCLPSTLSIRTKELVHLPWTTGRGEEPQYDSEGEEVTASYNEDESRPLQEGTIQVDVSMSFSKEFEPVIKKKKIPQAILIDEEDDIEDF